jgi:hypothetical protein
MDEETKAAPAGPVAKKFDIYTGDTIGQLPLAKINSHASTIQQPEKPKKSRFFGRGKGSGQPRKSVIAEAE